MTDEYGPPIPVNGKRPLDLPWNQSMRLAPMPECDGDVWDDRGNVLWGNVATVRIPADHPYYQSAEYKASVGDKSLWPSLADIPDFPKMAEMLEAAGYTVTPPDPDAQLREECAMLLDAWDGDGDAIRNNPNGEDARDMIGQLRDILKRRGVSP